MNGYLGEVNWDSLLEQGSVDDMINIFYDILYSVIQVAVPLKKVSQRNFPRWFSPALKDLIILKKQAHRAFKETGRREDYIAFSKLRSECKLLSASCYRRFVINSENALNNDGNIKKFWSYVNSRRKDNNLPSVMFYNDKYCKSGPDLPNLFAEYFGTVYSTRNCPVSESTSYSSINISDFQIEISTIFEGIIGLDIQKGPGPDGIPPCVLKSCSFVLSRPLPIIFNKSLSLGYFPNFWKVSFLTPIHKAGSKEDVSNYRPVCKLSTIPKLFENIVTKFLTSKLGFTIMPQQFGFQIGKSTELNLLTYEAYLSANLDNGGEVHSIYTDFSKAFDRVNHIILLNKLKSVGLGGSLLEWIGSYLANRTQIVNIRGFKSSDIRIPSGVPQGSHLGPLLFNLFINDIQICFKHSKFLCFADDLKCFLTVSSINDCINLQSDLHRLENWCLTNCMDLNASKCLSMCFSKRRNPIMYDYRIDNVVLAKTSSIRDLGITIDSALSFTPHISDIVSKALKMTGFVKRCTRDFTNVSAIRLLYCSLIRPILEYASSVWSPRYTCHIHRLEGVQRRFVRYLAFKAKIKPPEDYHYNYAELYERFSLVPLKDRREQSDLRNLFRILNSIVDCPDLLSMIGLAAPLRNTRTQYLFHQPFCRTNVALNSFITRTTRLANNLSPTLDFSTNEKSFVHFIKDCYM